MEDYFLPVCRDTHMTLEFVKAAELAAIPPGNMLRVQLRGQAILLANIEGRIFAIDDQCSHEDASLYNGALKGDCVECPLHGSRFRLATGEPLEPPATSAVRTWPVKIDGEAILIGFSLGS